MTDNFYRAFEDCHRGSRELIQQRLRAYLPFVTPLVTQFQTAKSLDLGCGRGEWIELLGQHGFDAAGVDLDDGMLEACREHGLNARKDDALSSLLAMPDNSLALVSAFHVVEHIPFDDVRAVIAQAMRVLKPGGLLIFETPNPENVVVGTSGFYMDPSHQRPIPPGLLSFAVEYAGFHRTKVIRLQDPEALHAMPRIGVLEVLFAVSPDYAVVAQKSADRNVLTAFDAPFHTDIGVSLSALAFKYDTQIQEQIQASEALLHRFEELVGDRAEQVERRFAQIEDKANWSVQQMHLAERRLHEVLTSYSWRLTAPLRWPFNTARRLRAAAREGRLLKAIYRRTIDQSPLEAFARRALMRLIREIDTRPAWRDAVMRREARLPWLAARLKSLHLPPSDDPNSAKPVSASARRILADIDRSRDEH